MPVFRHAGALHFFGEVPGGGGAAVTAHLAARFGALAFHEPGPADQRWAPWTRSTARHVAWSDFQRLVPEGWIASAFTVIRHPVDRIVALYNDRVARQHRVMAGLGVDDWFERELRGLRDDRHLHDNALRPQSDFAPHWAVCFRLEHGLDAVAAHLDATFGPAPAAPALFPIRHELPRAAGFAPGGDLPNRLVRRVGEVYAEDFERFGYPPWPASPPALLAPVVAGRGGIAGAGRSLGTRARGVLGRLYRRRD